MNGIKQKQVAEWSTYMKSKGIKRVLCLLSPDELKWYQKSYEQMMQDNGFDREKVTMVTMSSETALKDIQNALSGADKEQEPIVIHCSNGGGRAGLASSVWLNYKKKLSPEHACDVVVSYANKIGTKRRADVNKLLQLLREDEKKMAK